MLGLNTLLKSVKVRYPWFLVSRSFRMLATSDLEAVTLMVLINLSKS
jgi:hypothetical protein